MSGTGVTELAAPVRAAPADFDLPGELRLVGVSFRALSRNVERYPAGHSLARDAEQDGKVVVILSGWACEMRVLDDGRRQIFSFLLPGDPVDLAWGVSLERRAVVALTRLRAMDAGVMLQHTDDDGLRAAVSGADRQREHRLFDQMLRIGRLTARERVLNLLLELHDRLSSVGLARNGAYRLPVSQEVIADALGLSPVHINRTLRQLRQEGCITLRSGCVTLHEPRRLAGLAWYQARTDGDGIAEPGRRQ